MDADITTIQIAEIEDWYDLRYKLKTAQINHMYKDYREFDTLLKAVDNILKYASEHRRNYTRTGSVSSKRLYTEKITEANSVITIMQEHLLLSLLQKSHK
jgi:hypothetical protein